MLSLNNKDVRSATEPEVIELIKNAGMKIDLEVQTFEKVSRFGYSISIANKISIVFAG